MKNVLNCVLLVSVLLGLWWAYNSGYKSGINEERAKNAETAQKQEQQMSAANQKILDLQRIIANNNDECFNRVWDDEIIRAANP
jgi:hypothetical protein